MGRFSPVCASDELETGLSTFHSVWLTIVRDVFRNDERRDVRHALEEIASPLDGYGWSSAGIYSFWDPQSREVLYIGLAIDLPLRISQHFGLAGCPRAGCKRDQINEWFEGAGVLGLSVMLQTPNIQPVCHRLAHELQIDLRALEEEPEFDLDPLPGELEAQEGRLIALHENTYGSKPRWNPDRGQPAWHPPRSRAPRRRPLRDPHWEAGQLPRSPPLLAAPR